MQATISFCRYETAKRFGTLWSRFSLRGYSLSPKNAAGGAVVTLDGVTDTDKAWIGRAVELLKAEAGA